MFRVMFMGPRRMRESLGHESRDDALRFLAKHAGSIVSDVKIIAESGSVERFPARNDAAYYEGLLSIATVVVVEQVVPEAQAVTAWQAGTIMRLLNASPESSIATLRAMGMRFQVTSGTDDDSTIRARLRELAERALA